MFATRLFALITIAFLVTPASADVPQVVADTPVAQSLAAMVMGDLGTPVLLLDRGADPHDFQLRPSQARVLAHADLVIWTSPELSPWMARAVDSLVAGQVLVLEGLDGVHRQGFGQTSLISDSNSSHADDDPHQWLDPQNASLWLREIAARLASLDPENAALYTAHAEAAVDGIDSLRAEVAAILAPVGAAGLVMYHDAYGYFATAFGLNILGTVTTGNAAAPGAARIWAIRAALAASGAVCVFPEVNHSTALLGVITEGLPLRVGPPLDPAGVLLEPGPDLYGAVLRGLARAIADCVAGA